MTATLPDGVPVELYGRDSGPTDWYYVDSSLYHNGREIQSGLADLSSLEVNQKVGVLLSADGYLHVYLDGGHIRKAASCLPVNHCGIVGAKPETTIESYKQAYLNKLTYLILVKLQDFVSFFPADLHVFLDLHEAISLTN